MREHKTMILAVLGILGLNGIPPFARQVRHENATDNDRIVTADKVGGLRFETLVTLSARDKSSAPRAGQDLMGFRRGRGLLAAVQLAGPFLMSSQETP